MGEQRVKKERVKKDLGNLVTRLHGGFCDKHTPNEISKALCPTCLHEAFLIVANAEYARGWSEHRASLEEADD